MKRIRKSMLFGKWLTVATAAIFMAAYTGCVVPPSNGNANDNGNDNANDNVNDNQNDNGTPQVCVPFTATLDTDTTIPAGCYNVESDISVDGVTLTLDPGVTLKFAQETGMTVWASGRLSAVGTADDPIVLTGQEMIRGYWDGLRFYQSNSTTNRLENVTIEYGGGYWDANLVLDGSSSSPARVAINDCTLRQSETFGLRLNNAAADEFSGNTMTGNQLGAATTTPNDAGYLDDTSTYAGNDQDIVEVAGGTIDKAIGWPGIDADYLITGDIGVSAEFTLDPGASLVFESGNGMTVWSDGSLVAAGTTEDPIVLTGEEQTAGFWAGLRFYQSNATRNRIDHVIIEYGGGYWEANLYLDGSSTAPARVRITNTTLRNSGEYGLSLNESAIEEFANNTITANTLGAVNATPNDAGYLDDSTTYAGNVEDVVRIMGDTIDMDISWPGIDADYLISGDVGVSATLTLDPGVTLVFESGNGMTVWDDGSLAAVGTAANPIVLTGVEQTAGYWAGLRYYQSNSPNNQLAFVTIEYGGGYWNANLKLDGSSSSPVTIDVTDCTIENSETWGIYADEDCNLNADIETSNTFANNADGDFFQES